jgi:hypothetical protein
MLLIGIGLGIVLLVQIICVLALIDQYKGILQIRNQLRLRDDAVDLEIAEMGVDASEAGLPPPFSSEEGVVGVLFSTRCASCFSVAEGFKGRVPAGAWAIIAGSEPQCKEFQERVGLTGDRVLADVDGRIADKLRVRTFPSALLFARGELTAAKSVPSYRELRHVINDWHSRPLIANANEGNGSDGH